MATPPNGYHSFVRYISIAWCSRVGYANARCHTTITEARPCHARLAWPTACIKSGPFIARIGLVYFGFGELCTSYPCSSVSFYRFREKTKIHNTCTSTPQKKWSQRISYPSSQLVRASKPEGHAREAMRGVASAVETAWKSSTYRDSAGSISHMNGTPCLSSEISWKIIYGFLSEYLSRWLRKVRARVSMLARNETADIAESGNRHDVAYTQQLLRWAGVIVWCVASMFCRHMTLSGHIRFIKSFCAPRPLDVRIEGHSMYVRESSCLYFVVAACDLGIWVVLDSYKYQSRKIVRAERSVWCDVMTQATKLMLALERACLPIFYIAAFVSCQTVPDATCTHLQCSYHLHGWRISDEDPHKPATLVSCLTFLAEVDKKIILLARLQTMLG